MATALGQRILCFQVHVGRPALVPVVDDVAVLDDGNRFRADPLCS